MSTHVSTVPCQGRGEKGLSLRPEARTVTGPVSVRGQELPQSRLRSRGRPATVTEQLFITHFLNDLVLEVGERHLHVKIKKSLEDMTWTLFFFAVSQVKDLRISLIKGLVISLRPMTIQFHLLIP